MRTRPVLGLVLLVSLTAAACDDSGSEKSGKDKGPTTTAGPPSSTTTAPPPPPKVVAVAYTVTDGGDEKPPPVSYHAEFSLDGASVRVISDDGTSDLAYDAATGTSYAWGEATKSEREGAGLGTGEATVSSFLGRLLVGPGSDLAAFVRTLGRAGDARVTTVTSHGRPAWHYDGPYAGDMLGGTQIKGEMISDDHVVVDVDKVSGVALLEVRSGKGQETRRIEVTSIEDRADENRARYHPQPPATAKVTVADDGFAAMTLDEMAAAAGYDVLVPEAVPAGYVLVEVVFDAKKMIGSGAEGLNPAPARVASMRWHHPQGGSFIVTLRPENGDPKAKAEGQTWIDPFSSEGSDTPRTKVSLPLLSRAPLVGEMVLAAPEVPHLWGISGDLVVTLEGDLDDAGLRSVAGSLRRHAPPPKAPATGAGAPAKCPQIGFTPDSDDVAADITASAIDCAGASDLVRRVKQEHDPVTGPRLFRADPFTCRAVRNERVPLERTEYRCGDGARRVTWNKT